MHRFIHARYLLLLTGFCLISFCLISQPLFGQVAGVKHVVLIGIDGLSPDGVHTANTPQMDEMINGGAYSFKARSVRPTSSSPNWASMIMGAGPEQHGVTSNGWTANNFTISPVAKGVESIFPTIYSLLDVQTPDAVTASIYDWDGISRLFEHSAVDVVINASDAEDAVKMAQLTFTQYKPVFTFIHLDHVDHAGHASGWKSAPYYAAVTEADGYVKDITDGLASAGMLEETIIIIASDHGGSGTGHGGDSMSELETPWLIDGPGIEKDLEISEPVYIYDTAATIAAVLGVSQPYAWIGRPVLSVFEEGILTSNEASIEIPRQPAQFFISQNYPNPFGPETQFDIELAKSQHVDVALYDVQGKRIASLYEGVLPARQPHPIKVAVADLSNGIYMMRFQGEYFSTVRSVVLLK
ncbi:MAG: alkaline phosphatase family protein [Rhodothermales bacterium]